MDAQRVRLECLRAELMLSLRKAFERHVVALTTRPPPNEALNAWLFVQLARSHSAGLVSEEHLFVPLAPAEGGDDARAPECIDHGHGGAAWPLCKYFARAASRAGDAQDDALATSQALEVDTWLRAQWESRRQRLIEPGTDAELRDDGGGGGAGEALPLAVRSEARDDGSHRIWLEPRPSGQRTEHILNGPTLAKLRAGYTGEASEFEWRLFLLCHRYATLFGPHASEGRGWQLATPPAAMDLLRDDFGCGAECFASPFNRRQRHFCSAFADTDAPFGSSGSFFAAARHGVLREFGSAECGPPYDDGLMAMAVASLDAELASRPAGEAGTFVLVVPDWRTPRLSTFCRAFEASPFLSHVLTLHKDDHRYLDGFQHLASSGKRPRHVRGETATLLVFLQNAAAKEAHPITDDALERQRRAWNVAERA